MAEYGQMGSAMLGMLYGMDYTVDSFPCTEDVTPGKPVYQTPGSPTTVHSTYQSGDVFVGIAIATQQASKSSVGKYETHDVVNVLKRGMVWVQVKTPVTTAPAKAYATSDGMFTVTASGNIDVGAVFRTNQATASGLAVVEIAGIKV